MQQDVANARIIFLLVTGGFCALVVVVIAIAGALILFVGSRAVKGQSNREIESILNDWAEGQGFELLQVGGRDPHGSPFADRFGFGFGKRPAIVQSIEVRDRKGRTRHGWAYVQARMAGRGGYSGFLRDTLEVRLED
jgi:hypothetical protein